MTERTRSPKPARQVTRNSGEVLSGDVGPEHSGSRTKKVSKDARQENAEARKPEFDVVPTRIITNSNATPITSEKGVLPQLTLNVRKAPHNFLTDADPGPSTQGKRISIVNKPEASELPQLRINDGTTPKESLLKVPTEHHDPDPVFEARGDSRNEVRGGSSRHSAETDRDLDSTDAPEPPSFLRKKTKSLRQVSIDEYTCQKDLVLVLGGKTGPWDFRFGESGVEPLQPLNQGVLGPLAETYKALEFVHIPDPEADKEHAEHDPCALYRIASYLSQRYMKYLNRMSKKAPISIRMIVWNRDQGLEPTFKNLKVSEDEKDSEKPEEDEDEDEDEEAKAQKKKDKEKKEKEYSKAAKAEDERKKGDFSNALDLLRSILVNEKYRDTLTKHTIIVRCTNDGNKTTPDLLAEIFKKYNSPYFSPKHSDREQLKLAKKREYRESFILATADRAGDMNAKKVVDPHGLRRLRLRFHIHKPSKPLSEKARLVHDTNSYNSEERSLDDVWAFAMSYILEIKTNYSPAKDNDRIQSLFPFKNVADRPTRPEKLWEGCSHEIPRSILGLKLKLPKVILVFGDEHVFDGWKERGITRYLAQVTEKEKALLDYHVLNRGVQKVALSSSLPLVQKCLRNLYNLGRVIATVILWYGYKTEKRNENIPEYRDSIEQLIKTVQRYPLRDPESRLPQVVLVGPTPSQGGGHDESEHIDANRDKARICNVPFVDANQIIKDYRRKERAHRQKPENAPLTKTRQKKVKEEEKKEGTESHLDDALQMEISLAVRKVLLDAVHQRQSSMPTILSEATREESKTSADPSSPSFALRTKTGEAAKEKTSSPGSAKPSKNPIMSPEELEEALKKVV